MSPIKRDLLLARQIGAERYEEALETLLAQDKDDPSNPETKFLMASVLGWMGKETESERAAREAIALDEHHFGALQLLTNWAFKYGRDDEAKALATKAVHSYKSREPIRVPRLVSSLLGLLGRLPVPERAKQAIRGLQGDTADERWVEWARTLIAD